LIPVNERDFSFRGLQGRRIRCEHCGEPFSYLVEFRHKVSAVEFFLVSEDAETAGSLVRKALAYLRKQGAKERQGVALCPNCKRYYRERKGLDSWS
jgi:uncharacterized protein YbaR (Trm112 family)